MGARDVFDDLITGGWVRVQEWLAAQQPESLNLDFKRRKAGAPPGDLDAGDKDVMGKAISGLANVDGGVLVFGLETTKANKGNPNRLAPGQAGYLADADSFKRGLQKVFGSVTTPPVPGVMIEAITNPAEGPAGVVAVLVPSSDAKPHRTAAHLTAEVNNKYFMRTDTDTVVMPHEMLGALFGRMPPARLRLVVKMNTANPQGALMLYLANRGRATAREAIVCLDANSLQERQLLEPVMTKNMNRTPNGNFLVFEPHVVKTLYPGLEEYLGTINVRRSYGNLPTVVRLKGTIFAADAQPVEFDEDPDFIGHDTVELPGSRGG
jgi:hypothetical protein